MLKDTIHNIGQRMANYRRMTNVVSTCAGTFTAKRLERPIFIVGTGRCGTSLLVDIFDSHPRLAGFPNEANDLWHPNLYPYERSTLDVPPIEADPEGFTRASIDSWPSDQPGRIQQMFAGFHLLVGKDKIFFSKSAMTSFMIPSILDLFPDARFIHVYRFGPSVVESYIKKNFGSYSRYQVELAIYRNLCAKYWNACILEIEQRRNELNLDERAMFTELAYEKLCDDPNGELERLARFLEVDPADFTFDLTAVQSTNYKAGSSTQDSIWQEALAIMRPSLEMKGYLA